MAVELWLFLDCFCRGLELSIAFRHIARFRKRIEYWIVGQMLKEGLDVYLPIVDDDAIDAVIRKPDGTFTRCEIWKRSTVCRNSSRGTTKLLVRVPLRTNGHDLDNEFT